MRIGHHAIGPVALFQDGGADDRQPVGILDDSGYGPFHFLLPCRSFLQDNVFAPQFVGDILSGHYLADSVLDSGGFHAHFGPGVDIAGLVNE